MPIPHGSRYIALGSSFAAGPGLRPRARNSPRGSGRSEANYAHLLAARLGLDLVDATFSGATVRELLTSTARMGDAQIDAVTSDTRLITVTAGGNDVGYLPGLTLSSLPSPLRWLPHIKNRVAALLDVAALDARFTALEHDLATVVQQLEQRAPDARIILVDYLTVLPPAGTAQDRDLLPLPPGAAAWGRLVAERLTATTRAAALSGQVEFVAASEHFRPHHAWSDEPWTRRFYLGLRGGAPYHPTLAGMRGVAETLSQILEEGRS